MKDDNTSIQLLLNELTSRISSTFGKKVNFILLIGSAARGEFKPGISDIDLIIEVKDNNTKLKLEDFLSRVLWDLDKKYNTKIREAIDNDVFSFLSKNIKVYTPYEIFVEGEIDWEKGKINKHFGIVDPFISIPLFAEKIKKEGKILYGYDIRKVIKVRLPFYERLKLLIVPYLLSILAFLISIFSPDNGLKLAIKSLFYGIDDHLFFITGNIEVEKSIKMKMIKRILKHYSVRLIKEAFYIKYNFNRVSNEWTYFDKVSFCLESIFNLAYNNWVSFIYLLKRTFGRN